MLTVQFSPFPELLTERLLLRQQTEADKDAFFYLRSNAALMRFIPRPLHQTTDDTLRHIRMLNEGVAKNETINWVITFRDKPDHMIGTIGYVRIEKEDYRAEVGYLLSDQYHNRGIISEALQAVLQYGFSVMQLHSVEAVIDPENIASEKVLEKNGFVKEAHFRQNSYYNGVFLDSIHYSLLAADYAAIKARS